MASCFVDKREQLSSRYLCLIIAIVVALTLTGNLANAAGGYNERAATSFEARTVGESILAIVSLRSQKIIVYDANGWILQAPVSSGQAGRETPAGIFSIIQKEAEHYSNLYDDAYMPHMQRLTWSGIALHGGRLPGYPASHGCVRMPYDFAERLFDVTKLACARSERRTTWRLFRLSIRLCFSPSQMPMLLLSPEPRRLTRRPARPIRRD